MPVRVFSTGRVRPKRGARGVRRYLVEDWSDDTLPVNVFLVEHPDGLCLVDAGQSAHATKPGYFPSWYPFFRLSRFELTRREEAAVQLQDAGVDPSAVRWVVLTHMHTDHVGGIADFPNAEIVVARTEWERAQGVGGRLRGYLPQYWPPRMRPRVVDFTGPAVGPFAASCDVSGDGRLLLVPLPGHTPGHAALLAQVGPHERVLCAGDAALRAAELSMSAPDVAAWCAHERVPVLTAHDDAAAAIAAPLRTARNAEIAPR